MRHGLVTGYHLMKELFNEERPGRSHPEPEKAPRVSNFYLNGGPVGEVATERVYQARMRKLLSPAFSAKRIRGLEGRVGRLRYARADIPIDSR